MGLFHKKNSKVLGIDISPHSLKLLELGRFRGRYRVEAYGNERIPEGIVTEDAINDTEAVGACLRRLLAKAHTSLKFGAVAVSNSSTIIKSVKMPAALTEDELESQIMVEASDYIPYPIDEVALDFEVQGLDPQNAERVDVLVAACRKDRVECHDELLEMAGLKVKVVDIDVYAIERAYQHLIEPQIGASERNSPVAVIDIGASTTTIHVMEKGKITYTRSQSFGGHQMIQEMQHQYDMTADEAELAVKFQNFPANFEAEILAPFRATVTRQITRILQFFYSSTDVHEVDSIVLTGGVSSIADLALHVSRQEGVECIVADPFAEMAIGKKVNSVALANDAPALVLACGLAMRSFD